MLHRNLLCIFTVICVLFIRSVLPFTATIAAQNKISRCTLAQSFNNEMSRDEDPRVDAMRNILENSWDGKEMGTVPTNPEKAAEAAAQAVALAMGKSHNILMIDLRLPSYDILEGERLYDKTAVYDFCANLSKELNARKLITKSLVLVRNEKERSDIERARDISRRAQTAAIQMDMNDGEDEMDNDSLDIGSDEVAQFRKQLMNSWYSSPDTPVSSESMPSMDKSTTPMAADLDLSHRLWSMLASEEISTGSGMFDQVIAAVDKHARLNVQEQEDALIIVSPYDTADVVAVRRILTRYGNSRTIIIVNSRMETLPAEMNDAVLVYGVMPLVATRSISSEDEEQNDDEPGLRVVVMKRFPDPWRMFIDINGDGFVRADTDQPNADSKKFPSGEWIVKYVQRHLEGLSR